MTDYVFDTEPLVAFRYDEDGAECVEEMLKDVYDGDSTAAISRMTAMELAYVIGRMEDDINTGYRTVRDHKDGGVSVEPVSNHWKTASRIKMSGGISLGDAFSAALAYEKEATLVVGDDEEFDSLSVEIEITRL